MTMETREEQMAEDLWPLIQAQVKRMSVMAWAMLEGARVIADAGNGTITVFVSSAFSAKRLSSSSNRLVVEQALESIIGPCRVRFATYVQTRQLPEAID